MFLSDHVVVVGLQQEWAKISIRKIVILVMMPLMISNKIVEGGDDDGEWRGDTVAVKASLSAYQ